MTNTGLFTNLRNKKSKRIARGIAGKGGKTAGRGMNGQKSRAGSGRKISTLFEGGQTPLYMRMPKRRGFNHLVNKPVAISTTILSRIFKEGDLITPEKLLEKNIVKSKQLKHGVKIVKGLTEAKFKYENVLLSKSLQG